MSAITHDTSDLVNFMRFQKQTMFASVRILRKPKLYVAMLQASLTFTDYG